jgi:transcriptional regulator with XRE-family HTH domain
MDTPRRRTSRAYWKTAYDEFRERLIRARQSAGLTQRQAAELLGRSQSFIAKSENGERRVDVVELAEFARAYGRPLPFFFKTKRR